MEEGDSWSSGSGTSPFTTASRRRLKCLDLFRLVPRDLGRDYVLELDGARPAGRSALSVVHRGLRRSRTYNFPAIFQHTSGCDPLHCRIRPRRSCRRERYGERDSGQRGIFRESLLRRLRSIPAEDFRTVGDGHGRNGLIPGLRSLGRKLIGLVSPI